MLKFKSLLLFLLSLILCWSTAFGAKRGIRKVEIKTKSGETVGLYEESHALLIGVSNYTNGWSDLESVPDDIKAVSQALWKQNFHVVQVLNPTKKKFIAAFTDFIDNYGYKKNNRLLFYYSGHGYSKKVYERNTGYLVPSDTPDPSQDSIGFSQKAMPMTQIHAWAKQIEAKHALFLFDSCFSGSVLKERALVVPRQIQTLTAKPVRMFISAGTAGEPVPAESVFRHSFIRGIRGDADLDKDNYITGTELGLFIQRQVANYDTGQTPQFGKIKDPLYNEGDFVFLPHGSLETSRILKKQGVLFLRRENGVLGWFEDGDENNKHMEYVGEIENGMPNGNGESINFTNGEKFSGEFKHGFPIYGTGFSSDGSKYVGQLAAGKKHGQGTITYPNGLTYVGLFKYGKFDGHGILTFADGAKYVGEFKDDNQNGQGTLTMSDGTTHVGQFKNGKANGLGIMTFPDGEKHEGEFKDGLMNGKGSIILASGSTYVGMLKDDRKHGKGTYTWHDGRKYLGDYKFGARHGWGTYTWPGGNKYEGQYMNGEKHGWGTLFMSSGNKYEGEFKDGAFHGQGKYTFTDGGKFVGEFRSDKPWNVTEYLKDGTITGKYLNGKWK